MGYDAGVTGAPLPQDWSDWPAYYRAEAARLRERADTAETIEMRAALLKLAEQAEALAASGSA
jgi:uncharacterized protein (DUF2236 family)